MNPDPEPQLTRVRALAGELHAHGLHSIQDASPCLTLTSRPTRQAAPEHAARTAPDHGSTAHGPAPDLVLRMSALDLRPLPGAVPSARLHARFVACEWGLAAIAGDCELIVADSLNLMNYSCGLFWWVVVSGGCRGCRGLPSWGWGGWRSG
jgi:hypothetical protein